MSRVLAAAAVCAVLLAGCTGSSDPELPSESAFAEGTCRTAAPDVLTVGRTLPRLGEGGEVDQGVKDDLRAAQGELAALAGEASGTERTALEDLVEKLGIVRIRADSNTYEPAQGELLQRSFDAVVEVCTG